MKLNPGSKEASDAGCICPILDNGRGSGYMGMPGVFVFMEGCPVHQQQIENNSKKIDEREE